MPWTTTMWRWFVPTISGTDMTDMDGLFIGQTTLQYQVAGKVGSLLWPLLSMRHNVGEWHVWGSNILVQTSVSNWSSNEALSHLNHRSLNGNWSIFRTNKGSFKWRDPPVIFTDVLSERQTRGDPLSGCHTHKWRHLGRWTPGGSHRWSNTPPSPQWRQPTFLFWPKKKTRGSSSIPIPSGKTNITMDNHHFSWENPLWMAIFNSYVSHYQRVIFSQTPELKYSQTSQASHPIKSWALSEECGTPKATTTNDLRMLPKWYNRVNGLPVTCHSCGNSWDSFRNDPWILPHLCELLGVFHQYAINISQKKPLYPDVFPIFIHQLPSRTQTWQGKITISIDSFPHLKRGISQPRLHWAPWTDDLEGCRPLRRCRSCRPHREKMINGLV